MQADKATVVIKPLTDDDKKHLAESLAKSSPCGATDYKRISMTEFLFGPDAIKDELDKAKAGVSKVMGTIETKPGPNFKRDECIGYLSCHYTLDSRALEHWTNEELVDRLEKEKAFARLKDKPLPTEWKALPAVIEIDKKSWSDKLDAAQDKVADLKKAIDRQKGYSLSMTRDGTTITASAESMNECWILFEMAVKASVPKHEMALPVISIEELNEALYRKHGVRPHTEAPHEQPQPPFTSPPNTGRKPS